jgi:hypothetical protein
MEVASHSHEHDEMPLVVKTDALVDPWGGVSFLKPRASK